MKSGKVWGITNMIVDNTFVRICDLEILPNKRCSLHLHERHFNGFYVFDGQLTIEVHKAAYDLVDVTTLEPGQSMVVAPGEKHRFLTNYKGCTGIEYYWPDTSQEDIVRDDVGGSA